MGGLEIVGHDVETGSPRAQFFESVGNVSTSRVTVDGDAWTWSGERTRCTSVVSDDGKMFTGPPGAFERWRDVGALMEVVRRVS